MSDTTRDLRGYGRRRFVKTLGAMGVSANALRYLTQDELEDLTGDPSDRIPILSFLRHANHDEFVASIRDGTPVELEREPVYEVVDRERWAVVEAAHDAAGRIRRRVDDPLVDVGVRTARTGGGHSEKRVVVSHTTIESHAGVLEPDTTVAALEERLPATADGAMGAGSYRRELQDVPVVVDSRRIVDEDNPYYDGKYSPVPAGVQMEDANDTSGYTLGTPAQDESGEAIWVTAGHAYFNNDKETVLAYQDEYDGQWLGEMQHYTDDGEQDAVYGFNDSQPDLDAAVIRKAGSGRSRKFDIGSDSWWEDYEGWPVKGAVSWDRIKYNEDNSGFSIYLQGANSGRQEGTITEVYDDYFTTDASHGGGDSGGPHFEVVDGDSYIAGIHKGGGGDAVASGMVHIEDYLGLTV